MEIGFGYGYGTFTILASKLISGTVYAFDIESPFANKLYHQIRQLSISNIFPEKRDVVEIGTGLPNNTTDYVALFNVLHGVRGSRYY